MFEDLSDSCFFVISAVYFNPETAAVRSLMMAGRQRRAGQGPWSQTDLNSNDISVTH